MEIQNNLKDDCDISNIRLEFRKILNLYHCINLLNTSLHNYQTAIFNEIVALQCYATHIQAMLYLIHNSIALCFENVIKFNISINGILGINELSNSTNAVVITKVMLYEYSYSSKYSFINESTKIFADEYEIDHANQTHVLNEILLLLILENETTNISIDFNNSTDGLTKVINGESFLLNNIIKHIIILSKNYYSKFYPNSTLDELIYGNEEFFIQLIHNIMVIWLIICMLLEVKHW